jgi:hypothetical protein
MSNNSKLTLSDFVSKDRFELNLYISYLFHQFNYENQVQSNGKMVKQ